MKSAASLGLLAASTATSRIAQGTEQDPEAHRKENLIPFWGKYQAGILTPQQSHTYFAAFDLTAKKREDVVGLLREWTEASEKLTQGSPVEIKKKKISPPDSAKSGEANSDDSYNPGASRADSGETQTLSPDNLTVTFGFGAGLFVGKEGHDRFGLAKFRPEALVDLPRFHGDELVEEKCGGDLSVQACSDDPQVAFHAIRLLARAAEGIAQIRWVQTGFLSRGPHKETPRNLMGFKDGTQQPNATDWDKFVWADKKTETWMRGGTYLVARRIRMALEHWDRTEVEFQEQVIGRSKRSGAPLGQKHEKEVLHLAATDKDGNLIIPANAHVRLGAMATNDGSQIFRRGYSYNEGVNFTAERWPPWRQGLEYDAGLFFLGYQSDPRTGFIKIFQNMAKLDALNQFVTHVGSGLFACPPGMQKGEYIGQKLFDSV